MAQNTLTYTFHSWVFFCPGLFLSGDFCSVPIYFSSFELQILIESNMNPQKLPFQLAGPKFLFFLMVVFTSTILFL